jgi:predicted amidophosphoribosyltransferase
MRLIWLSYFDPRKDYKTVWWCRGDSTDAGMRCPCCGRDIPRMKCPLKGRFLLML